MGRKRADVDFHKCTPLDCERVRGFCAASAACRHKLLEQEAPDEPPMLFAAAYCVGCGDCVGVCPAGAVSISSGM
jgi:Fe-S-cluster-containing hydrogenase component 2